VILIVSGGSMATWGAMVVLGLGMGGVGALMPLVIVDMFGLRQFGSIMGLTSVPITIPVVVGPILAGMIFDSMGDYNLMFVITGGMLLISVGAFMLAKPPPRAVIPLHK
jgi:MFS family permease